MTIRTTLIASSLIAANLVSGAAQAALVDRGGGLIYDTDLNVTWLKDTNYAQTSGYDADGRMTWSQAVTWADNLSYYDSVRNVTYSDWRLPATTPTDNGTNDCNFAYSGTDCGYNVNPVSSEMAHLYFTELGNLSDYSTELGNLSDYTASGAVIGAYAGGSNPNSTLDNTGPFTNFQSDTYWSGMEYVGNTDDAWAFHTSYGFQGDDDKGDLFYALAVRPGDVAAVPEAQTYALMLAGLGLVGWRARRRG